MTQLWKRLDISQADVIHIVSEDHIVYAREYIAGRKYDASETNNLVTNFKKPTERINLPEWRYKLAAIEQFATELSDLFKKDIEYVLVAMPTSKHKSDPKYDSRLEDTLISLSKKKCNVTIQEPFILKDTMIPSHSGGTRSPQIIYDNLLWRGFAAHTHRVFLVDDLLTTGSHFKACQRLILEHHPEMEVIGIFWAKAIWDNPFSVFG